MFKSNKGYSLVEIGVGIIILVIFLFFSVGLINGCYTNYRRIRQRNLAIDRAVFHIETLLQSDRNVLTGFLLETVEDNKMKYIPNPKVTEYVKKTENFDNIFKVRYASSVGKSKDEITSVTDKELEEYIVKDIDYVANRYIENVAISSTTAENLKNGDYGFLKVDSPYELWKGPYEVTFYGEIIYNSPFNYEYKDDDGQEIYSTPEDNFISSNYRSLKIVRRVKRIPATDGKAYGNNVLKIEVEVFYPKNGKVIKNNIREIPEDELESIVISTIKTSN